MSETYRDILGLRAVRAFTAEPLRADDAAKILEAARWTGSSKNRQLWSFVLVRDPEQKERLAACGQFTVPIRNAPAALALVQEDEGYEFDIGRVAQNVMLAAQAIGVASCPITLHREDQAHEVLGLPPGARCRYAIALGYPESSARPSTYSGRKALSELAHAESYGEPVEDLA
jgi:nitroreductase